MASLTAILQLVNLVQGESSYGSFTNWGDVADFNFASLEATVGEVTSKTLAGTDVTLTDTEELSLLIKLSGTLSANVSVETNDRKGFWMVANDCTGDFTVTFKTTSGSGVVVPQGGKALLVSDGTNVLRLAVLQANGAGARPKYAAKSAGFTAGVSDDGSFYDCTSTLTIALKPAALLGDQWSMIVKANGADITIDPDGAETIDGAATLTVTDGDAAIVICNGTAFFSLTIAAASALTASSTTTLSNKNLVDATTKIVGSGDATKTVRFEVDGNTTGTDRVVTARDADGTLGYQDDTQGQHTIWIPAGAMTPATTSGAAVGALESTTNKVMLPYLAFDASAEEFAQFAVEMPKSWDEGTFVAEFVWSHPATTTNFGVVWGLEALALSDDDALDTAWGTEVATADTGGTTNDIYKSPESSAVTPGNTAAAEDLVMFRVTRVVGNASDTMAVDAYLIGVRLHYTTNANTDD